MQNDISVAALCLKLEQKLMEVWNNELTLERYRKVLAEFTVLQVTAVTASRLTLSFLIARFTEREGSFPQMNTPGRKKRISGACGCLQNTTTLALSTDGMYFFGEIVWPGPFRQCTGKGFLRPS